jgi:hypothetical protein
VSTQSGQVSAVNSIPDLQPFLVDPIILGRLRRANVGPLAFAAMTAVGTVIAVSWSASISNLFYRPAGSVGLWGDVWSFVFRHKADGPQQSIPYLRDYPSIVLTITIATSLCLVYALYCAAAVLHSDMASAGCVRYNDAGRVALTNAVNDVNVKFGRWGRFSPVVLFLSFVCAVLLNLRLRSDLFAFLGSKGLYQNWWASLHPLRPGGIIWVLFGTLGIYMVYAESVLGLAYVKFLRKCRGDYNFRANMLNPDGLFGWSRLRQIMSNLEAGVLCTLLSAWAISFFLQPAAGSVVTVAVLAVFVGMVSYVFIEVNLNFRRQVRQDKNAQRTEIGQEIADSNAGSEVKDLLRILVAYQRLELVSRIPSTPIRQRWLVAGALSVIGPLSAIAVQLIKYFTTK